MSSQADPSAMLLQLQHHLSTAADPQAMNPQSYGRPSSQSTSPVPVSSSVPTSPSVPTAPTTPTATNLPPSQPAQPSPTATPAQTPPAIQPNQLGQPQTLQGKRPAPAMNQPVQKVRILDPPSVRLAQAAAAANEYNVQQSQPLPPGPIARPPGIEGMTGLRFERQKLMAPQVPGPGYSYVGQLQDQTRQRFYDILAELDPYRATPKEFVNLLVNAAMRDEEIGKSIYRMNEDRLRNPESWRPLKPAGFRSPQPSPQPIPAQPTPASMTASPVSSAPQTTLPSQAPMHKPPYNTPQSMAFQVPTPHDEHMPMVPMVPSVQPLSGDAVSNQPLDNTVETDDEPSEPKEQGCDYNWVLERAAWHLGWTGSFDSLPDVQQANVGYSAAFKLLNLLQKTHDLMDKHVTFADRVHILTIMRDVMAATLETNSRVGASCREHAHSYDDNFVGAVNKLTESQKKRLKVLADGKWLHELQGLVEAAERQNMFPRLSEALVTIDC